jgi:phospholipid-transporting ATPase
MENSMPLAENTIRTSKYTLLSFFPLNLLYQLMKPANIYFIIICVLQMIKPISITGGSPTNLPPLLFVMAVSGVKDFFEDRVR